jgi:hypothetical protein
MIMQNGMLDAEGKHFKYHLLPNDRYCEVSKIYKQRDSVLDISLLSHTLRRFRPLKLNLTKSRKLVSFDACGPFARCPLCGLCAPSPMGRSIGLLTSLSTSSKRLFRSGAQVELVSFFPSIPRLPFLGGEGNHQVAFAMRFQGYRLNPGTST